MVYKDTDTDTDTTHINPENYDLELHKASINVTEVLATPLPDDSTLFTVSYEFLAQYADGQRWVKDSAIVIGTTGPEFLADFKRRLIEAVRRERSVLRRTKLNGEAA